MLIGSGLVFGVINLILLVSGPFGRFSAEQWTAYWAGWTAIGTLGLGVGAVMIAYYESQRAGRERRSNFNQLAWLVEAQLTPHSDGSELALWNGSGITWRNLVIEFEARVVEDDSAPSVSRRQDYGALPPGTTSMHNVLSNFSGVSIPQPSRDWIRVHLNEYALSAVLVLSDADDNDHRVPVKDDRRT